MNRVRFSTLFLSISSIIYLARHSTNLPNEYLFWRIGLNTPVFRPLSTPHKTSAFPLQFTPSTHTHWQMGKIFLPIPTINTNWKFPSLFASELSFKATLHSSPVSLFLGHLPVLPSSKIHLYPLLATAIPFALLQKSLIPFNSFLNILHFANSLPECPSFLNSKKNNSWFFWQHVCQSKGGIGISFIIWKGSCHSYKSPQFSFVVPE